MRVLTAIGVFIALVSAQFFGQTSASSDRNKVALADPISTEFSHRKGPIFSSPVRAAAAPGVGTIIANAWNAFSGGVPVHSIQQSGQVSTQIGPSAESGTIAATVSADTTDAIQLSMSSGNLSETRVAVSGGYQCSWAAADAVQHRAADHNCWQTVSWLAPSLALQPSITPSNIGIAYIGHEMIGNEGVEHLQLQVIYGTAQTPPSTTSLIQLVSTADLYLDSSSYLPVMLAYALRSDNDANTSIPVEVHYSSFAQISGVTIPQHIERSIDGSLRDVININSISTH